MVERNLAKVDVAGPIPVSRSPKKVRSTFQKGQTSICGNGSVVERNLAKVDVAGPIPVSRSKLEGDLEETQIAFFLNNFYQGDSK